jgi:hypothetical protein
MKKRIIRFFIAVNLFLIITKVSFAQEVLFTPRENVIFSTLNSIHIREEAIKEAMMEAQLKLLAARPPQPSVSPPRESGWSLSSLKSITHPYLTLKTTYDSNIDNQEHDPKGELFHIITPGLKMNFVGRTKSINLDLHIDDTSYSRYIGGNATDASFGCVGTFNIGRFVLTLGNTYLNNFIIGPGFYNSEATYKWRHDNLFKWSLGANFNRLGFDLGYSQRILYYKHDFHLENNSFIDSYKFNQYLKIATKTLINFGYIHERTNYLKQTKISNSDEFSLAITSVLTPKVTGLFKMSYKPTDNKTDDDERISTFTGNLGYNFSNRSNLALKYNYSIKEYATKQHYLKENDITLTWNHHFAFNPKFKILLSYGADFNDYPKKTLKDRHTNNYTTEVGLSYAFRKWLFFNLDWKNYESRSNLVTGGTTDDQTATPYEENVVTFTTEAKF